MEDVKEEWHSSAQTGQPDQDTSSSKSSKAYIYWRAEAAHFLTDRIQEGLDRPGNYYADVSAQRTTCDDEHLDQIELEWMLFLCTEYEPRLVYGDWNWDPSELWKHACTNGDCFNVM